MSTLSPNHTRYSIMKAASIAPSSSSSSPALFAKSSSHNASNMALAHTAPKQKAVSAKAAKAAAHGDSSLTAKQKSQMHRRSRTGCYTCRLRRKKCDEGAPLCTACKHLGLTCEYKRPQWWSNNEARRSQKDDIKVIIKRKKLSEKSTSAAALAAHMQAASAAASSPPGGAPASMVSPPGLSSSCSLPTPATFSTIDPLDRTRSASIDSHYTFDFNSPPTSASEYGGPASAGLVFATTPQLHPDYMFANAFHMPYEVDVKTERQMFVNDVPTLRESTTSTYSTFQSPPPPGAILPSYHPATGMAVLDPGMEAAAGVVPGDWVDPSLTAAAGAVDASLGLAIPPFVDYASSQESAAVAQQHPMMQPAALDAGDQRLLDHFVLYVLPAIFPLLEAGQPGAAAADLILPALQSNKGYLHCCLSAAAQHLKAAATAAQSDAQAIQELDDDVMRHRFAAVGVMCNEMNRDENHQQVLETALGLMFFQCYVGRSDDALPDIAWHQHMQAAASLVQRLDLPRLVTMGPPPKQELPPPPPPQQQQPDEAGCSTADDQQQQQVAGAPAPAPTPFNMTLTAWIDILGATMQGRAPTFAHTYREKHLSAPHALSLGLRELMGCEDRVLYLISEIACLEALKADGMDDITLCQHVSVLGDQLGLTELGEAPATLPFTANGSLSAAQLSKNLTAAFRLAARVYLCSLVPGFSPAQASCVGLVEKLTAVLQTIPCGPAGFDRCAVWVYLVAGAVSLPGSSFRAFFEDRLEQMGAVAANVGSFGRMVMLLREVWQQNLLLQQHQHQQPKGPAGASSPQALVSPLEGSPQYIHWRDVMHMKGWDFLLI